MSQALTASQMCARTRLQAPLLLQATATVPHPGRRNASLPLQLHVRLIHYSPAAQLCCRNSTPRARPVSLAAFSIRVPQARNESTLPPRGRKPPPPRRIGFFRVFASLLGGSLRSIGKPFNRQTFKELFRQNPEELVIAIFVLIVAAGLLVYTIYLYFAYFYSRQFTRYPPTVAKYLRRALYFSNYSPDPKRALRNYRLALEQCNLLELDQYSDDVLGIRIQISAWLEKIENYEMATKVLDALLYDCQHWVEAMEQSVKDGTIKDDGTTSSRLPPQKKTKEEEEKGDLGETETLWARRNRLLKKCIAASMKLGELYANEHMLKDEQAHDRLVWAVETALKEARRRTAEGVKPGEGPWMTTKEMGASLEALGGSYESRSQFQLALPLFFQALRMCDDPCHTAVIMNNLAISFAQHPLKPPYDTLVGPLIDAPKGSKPPTKEEARKEFLETAKRWANNAHEHATEVTGEARTPECDTACAVSLCNLGDIAAMLGNLEEARRMFEQGREMSQSLEFDQGVQQAEAGLKRLAAP